MPCKSINISIGYYSNYLIYVYIYIIIYKLNAYTGLWLVTFAFLSNISTQWQFPGVMEIGVVTSNTMWGHNIPYSGYYHSIWASYGMSFVNICGKIDRIITAPHCIYFIRIFLVYKYVWLLWNAVFIRRFINGERCRVSIVCHWMSISSKRKLSQYLDLQFVVLIMCQPWRIW